MTDTNKTMVKHQAAAKQHLANLGETRQQTQATVEAHLAATRHPAQNKPATTMPTPEP